MMSSIFKLRTRVLFRSLSFFLILCFCTSLVIFPKAGYAKSILNLPPPGAMVALSPEFTPVIMRGIRFYPDNPLKFDFIVDKGDGLGKDRDSGSLLLDPGSQETRLKEESQKLIKYFLAALTVPEEDLWVNLSPFEKGRIIPEKLGMTEMGRDMLAQDYLLKQLSSSLTYPESELGRTFWKKVRTKAKQLYGTAEIPMETFNKVWIVPEKAEVFETKDMVFVSESYLKVMLEEDYLAEEQNIENSSVLWAVSHAQEDENQERRAQSSKRTAQDSNIYSHFLKEIILPEIEREVNRGANFANLRQIYNSLILAIWFKQNLKQSLLGQIYADQGKIAGVDVKDKAIQQKIYQQYLEAYQQGVYDYIKEDEEYFASAPAPQVIPRKYFSGGLGWVNAVGRVLDPVPVEEFLGDPGLAAMQTAVSDSSLLAIPAVLVETDSSGTARSPEVSGFSPAAQNQTPPQSPDAAMVGEIGEAIFQDLHPQGVSFEDFQSYLKSRNVNPNATVAMATDSARIQLSVVTSFHHEGFHRLSSDDQQEVQRQVFEYVLAKLSNPENTYRRYSLGGQKTGGNFVGEFTNAWIVAGQYAYGVWVEEGQVRFQRHLQDFQTPQEEMKTFALNTEIVIGRRGDPRAEGVYVLPSDTSLSAHHATLIVEETLGDDNVYRLTLIDENSTNGTTVWVIPASSDRAMLSVAEFKAIAQKGYRAVTLEDVEKVIYDMLYYMHLLRVAAQNRSPGRAEMLFLNPDVQKFRSEYQFLWDLYHREREEQGTVPVFREISFHQILERALQRFQSEIFPMTESLGEDVSSERLLIRDILFELIAEEALHLNLMTYVNRELQDYFGIGELRARRRAEDSSLTWTLESSSRQMNYRLELTPRGLTFQRDEMTAVSEQFSVTFTGSRPIRNVSRDGLRPGENDIEILSVTDENFHLIVNRLSSLGYRYSGYNVSERGLFLQNREVIPSGSILFLVGDESRGINTVILKSVNPDAALLTEGGGNNADGSVSWSGFPIEVGATSWSQDPLGGIDVSDVQQTLQIRRDGNGVALPFQMQPPGLELRHGLTPLILDMVPMTTLPFSVSALQLQELSPELSRVNGF